MKPPLGRPLSRMLGSSNMPPWVRSIIPAPAALAVAVDEVSGGLTLSWDAVSSADSYSTYYRIDGGAWQSIATGITDTSYTYAPTEAGEYEFAVTSVKGSKESAKTEWTSTDGIFDDVPDDEGIALMSFYESTAGDSWTDNTGWMTDPTVGNWFGVTVEAGHVTEVDLVDNGLEGDIGAWQETEFGLSTYLKAWDNPLITFSSNFIIQAKTDNAGTSNDNQIMLPIQGTDMVIDWGDGTVETVTQANTPNNTIDGDNVAHTYDVAGTYNVKIGPQITRVFFNNGGDKDKLLDINNWGDAVWGSNFGYAFQGCSNVVSSFTDTPNTSAVTNFRQAFSGCSTLTGNASMQSWDVSLAVRDFAGLRQVFEGSGFNTDLSGWQLGLDLADLYRIFRFSGMSAENYSRILIGWANYVHANGAPHTVDMSDQSGCTYNNTVYGGSPFNNAVDARAFLVETTANDGAGWTIDGDSEVA